MCAKQEKTGPGNFPHLGLGWCVADPRRISLSERHKSKMPGSPNKNMDAPKRKRPKRSPRKKGGGKNAAAEAPDEKDDEVDDIVPIWLGAADGASTGVEVAMPVRVLKLMLEAVALGCAIEHGHVHANMSSMMSFEGQEGGGAFVVRFKSARDMHKKRPDTGAFEFVCLANLKQEFPLLMQDELDEAMGPRQWRAHHTSMVYIVVHLDAQIVRGKTALIGVLPRIHGQGAMDDDRVHAYDERAVLDPYPVTLLLAIPNAMGRVAEDDGVIQWTRARHCMIQGCSKRMISSPVSVPINADFISCATCGLEWVCGLEHSEQAGWQRHVAACQSAGGAHDQFDASLLTMWGGEEQQSDRFTPDEVRYSTCPHPLDAALKMVTAKIELATAKFE